MTSGENNFKFYPLPPPSREDTTECVRLLYFYFGSIPTMHKAKAYNTCMAQQAAYRSCSGAVHVTDSGRTAYRP